MHNSGEVEITSTNVPGMTYLSFHSCCRMHCPDGEPECNQCARQATDRTRTVVQC